MDSARQQKLVLKKETVASSGISIIFLLSLLIFSFVPECYGQEILQVATKTFNKTVDAGSIRTLHVNAEKADIELVAWNKSEISIKMELSAKHPDKAIAASDLSKFQYLADKSGKDYFLRNYILLKDGESKPASNLKAKYTIYLPPTCAVDIKNTFGTIITKGLTNNLQIRADFCTTSLANLKGKGTFETNFGELKTKDIMGSFLVKSDHTNLNLENIGGEISINAHYGNVFIYPTAQLNSLAIQSKKAEVIMTAQHWQMFDYSISSAYANIHLPNGFKWKKNTPEFKDAFYSKAQSSVVHIEAEFGNVTIK